MAITETTQQDKKKQKARDLILASFLLLVSDTTDHLQALTGRYLAGTLPFWQFSDALTAALVGAHTQASHLGRRLSGQTAPLAARDAEIARNVMMGQAAYLHGLLTDLQVGKYGEPDSPALANRLGMYAKRLRGTAEAAWVEASDADAVIEWVTTSKESCPGCVEMEGGNPYTRDTLDKMPGSGETECVLGCACFLTVDGERGFELE